MLIKLRSLLNRYASTITFNDPNSIDYRLDEYMGSESSYYGFRTAILYFQLSEKINLDAIMPILNVISPRFLKPHKGHFATLFLNSQDGKLIYPYSTADNLKAVNFIVRDYYRKFAVSNESFSHDLNNLYPPTNHQDICILFCEEKGVSINADVKTRASRLKWIVVNIEKDKTVEVNKLII